MIPICDRGADSFIHSGSYIFIVEKEAEVVFIKSPLYNPSEALIAEPRYVLRERCMFVPRQQPGDNTYLDFW